MEICDELRSFEATGVYRLDGTGATFLDPVRILNGSYQRFRVVPSAYYSRSFEPPPRQVGDLETEQPEKRRKRQRNQKPKPRELNAMERIAEARHQVLLYYCDRVDNQCCFRYDALGSFDVQKTSFPLFNSIINVEAIDEAEGEFQNRRYILPRESCFLMTDYKHVRDLIPGRSNQGYNLIVVDPPWENGCVRQKQAEKLRVFVEQELLPTWGVKDPTVFYWLKVKPDGSLIGDLDLFHHRPYECLLLGYINVNTDAKQGSNFKLLEGSQVIMSVPGAHSRKPPLENPQYVAFHDDEWGVPVHDDRTLFELFTLSQALAELTWPAILSKREEFREMFDKFNPASISEFTEKKITMLRSNASVLLSEQKIRAVVTNAKQMRKVVQEFGSFSNYCWSFVNHKPITNCFRYARQVPTKTPKAEAISKDLMRRGFQCVGPTTIYSFMQVAGIVNDHLSCCFRFKACSEHKASEKIVRAEPALPDRRLSSPSSEDSDIREM
nr:unnamed protein product [Digitaria exilis]